MMKNEIQTRAEEIIREHPESRILNFTFDRKKYWIKRKMGNGRNQWIKYSVEKEFYYELARMRIAGEFHPELIPNLVLLTSDYMVTEDGGPTLKNMLDSDIPEEEKLSILKKSRRRSGFPPCRRHHPRPPCSPGYCIQRRKIHFP